MRTVPHSTTAAWTSGDLTGSNRPMCRVTCQHGGTKLYDVPHNLYASRIFGSDAVPLELPNLKSITWSRSLDQDFASATLVFYNTRPLRIGERPTRDLDLPGYYTPTRGKTTFSSRWGQKKNQYAEALVPDNIIRTYEGYGFDPTEIPEKDPFLTQTGVWRIDEVEFDALSVLVTVTCRDIGSTLGDEIVFAPVIPSNFYPLSFTATPKRSGFNAPQTYTLTGDIGGKYNKAHPPPGGWAGPTAAPVVTGWSAASKSVTINWNAATATGNFKVRGYRIVLDNQRGSKIYPPTARTATITRLTNGNVYGLQVQALYQETLLGAGTVNPHPGTTHTIVSGDTLWALAQFYYGDPLKWGVIARANGIDDSGPMDYDVRHLQIGRVLTIPSSSLSPQPQDSSGTLLRSEWGDISGLVLAHPGVSGAPTIVPLSIRTDYDQHANLQPNWVSWTCNDHGHPTTWRVIAYRGGNPPAQIRFFTAISAPGTTEMHVDTGGTLGAMNGWNYLAYGIQDDPTYTWQQRKAGKGTIPTAIGGGDALYRADTGNGEFFAPPTEATFPHMPGPTPKGATVTTKGGSTLPVKETQLKMSYSDSSNTPYIGHEGNVYGHTPYDAFDANDNSYWLSIGNARPDQGYSYEWCEGAIPQSTLTHVKFRTVNASAGAYVVYVSVYAHGKWVSFNPYDIVPYNEYLPEAHNHADIPYAGSYSEGRGGDEGPHTVVFKTPILGATRVRLTFYNLQNFAEFGYGGYSYRAGLRTMQAYGYSGASTHSGPTVDTIYDDVSPQIVKTYEVYAPPEIVPGAGEHPGKFEDFTDIVKLFAAWGGFFWPEKAKIRLSDGSYEEYNFGTGPYGLENVDPVLGRQGSGRVWGDFETVGTASVATLTIDLFDKKPLMDGITYVRNAIGFNFFIDETGGVVWRNPNIYSVGNFVGDLSKDAGRTSKVITIDEKQTLIGLHAKLSGRSVRERVLVASVDGKNASLAKGYNPNPTGLRRVTVYSDMHFTSKSDTIWTADLICINQLMTYRNDQVTILANPAIQIDDQVRIFEQTTSEGYLHYVRAISSNLDMETGVWTYELTTQWLGERPFDVWLFNPKDLSKEFQQYIKALTYVQNDANGISGNSNASASTSTTNLSNYNPPSQDPTVKPAPRPVIVPPSFTPTVKLYGFLASSRGDASGAWPGVTATPGATTVRGSIMKKALHGVCVQTAESGGVVGLYESDGVTLASASTAYNNYDWSGMDKRMEDVAAALAPGGEITIVAYPPCPFWMMVENNGAGSTPVTNFGSGPGGLLSSTCADKYVTTTTAGNSTGKSAVDFVEYMLSRYLGLGYNVTRLIVEQELRGRFSTGGRAANSLITTACPANSWDIWRYAFMYNAIWSKLKGSSNPAVAAVKIGGPYVVCRGQLNSGAVGATGNVTASNGDVLRGTTTVNGVGWHFDSKVLDVVARFSTLATGVDFWVNDGSQFQSTTNPAQSNSDMIPTTPWTAGTAGTRVTFDGSVALDDREKAAIFGPYVQRFFAGKEMVWSEGYPSSNNDPAEAQIVYPQWQAGGYKAVYLWMGPQSALSLTTLQRQGVGVSLWKPAAASATPSDVITPMGVWAQGITAVTG